MLSSLARRFSSTNEALMYMRYFPKKNLPHIQKFLTENNIPCTKSNTLGEDFEIHDFNTSDGKEVRLTIECNKSLTQHGLQVLAPQDLLGQIKEFVDSSEH